VKYFFGLHIKRFINLKIFGATFGIGGGKLPPLPTLATRLLERNNTSSVLVLIFVPSWSHAA